MYTFLTTYSVRSNVRIYGLESKIKKRHEEQLNKIFPICAFWLPDNTRVNSNLLYIFYIYIYIERERVKE